jgi:hypothetical protein
MRYDIIFHNDSLLLMRKKPIQCVNDTAPAAKIHSSTSPVQIAIPIDSMGYQIPSGCARLRHRLIPRHGTIGSHIQTLGPHHTQGIQNSSRCIWPPENNQQYRG